MIKQENEILIRINRKKAKRVFDGGKPVFLLPCKMRLDNYFQKPVKIEKEKINYISNDGYNTIVARNNEFETIENAFIYYNCNYNETGKYPAYFMKKEDL